MPHPRVDDTPPGPLGMRASSLALGVFWGAFLALYTLRGALLGYHHPGAAFSRRLAVAAVGAAIALGMRRVLNAMGAASWRTRIAWTAGLSLPAAALFATANFLVFNVIAPLGGETCVTGLACTVPARLAEISDLAINWVFVFAAWGMLHLAMAYQDEARAADRRAAMLRQAAVDAEVRALRYQVNPHFLFNLLNSLSSLVMRRRLADAEALIGDLAAFFRMTLAADPHIDTTVDDEIATQLRYLDLERRRFPDRLDVVCDIAPEAAGAAIPALLLQPLVENAIKHGLERTTARVTIGICARRDGDGQLHIRVDDDAPPASDAAPPPRPGLGVGLDNVGRRLQGRFGPQARLTAGPRIGGDGRARGFRVELRIPTVGGRCA